MLGGDILTKKLTLEDQKNNFLMGTLEDRKNNFLVMDCDDPTLFADVLTIEGPDGLYEFLTDTVMMGNPEIGFATGGPKLFADVLAAEGPDGLYDFLKNVINRGFAMPDVGPGNLDEFFDSPDELDKFLKDIKSLCNALSEQC